MKHYRFCLLLFTLVFLLVGCTSKEEPYRIVFNTNGGEEITSITMKDLDAFEAPLPTKARHRFDGWFMDEAFDVPYAATRVENLRVVTLHAKWTLVSVYIYFDTQGGTQVDAVLQAPGSTLVEPTAPVREGFGFIGWALSPGETLLFAFDIMPNQDVIVYALWVPLDESGGTSFEDTFTMQVNVNYYHNFEESYMAVYYQFKPTQSGVYQFRSFGDSDPYAKLYDDAFEVIAEADDVDHMNYNFILEHELLSAKTYYFRVSLFNIKVGEFMLRALFIGPNVEYSFETNGGSPLSVYRGIEVQLEPVTEKSGMYFAGWYDSPGFDGEAVVFPYRQASDTVLYAKWSSTVVPNGKTIESAYTVYENNLIPVAINTPGKRVYFQFVATASSSYSIYSLGNYDTYGSLYDDQGTLIAYNDDGPGTENFRITRVLTLGQTYTVGVRLYDNEEIAAFTLLIDNNLLSTLYTFNAMGGSTPETVEENFLHYAHLSTRDGYFFAGWYDNEGYHGEPIAYPYRSNEAVTLYARWSLNRIHDGLSLESAVEINESTRLVVHFYSGMEYYIKLSPTRSGLYIIGSEGGMDTVGALYDNLLELMMENDDRPLDANFILEPILENDKDYIVKVTLFNETDYGQVEVYIQFIG